MDTNTPLKDENKFIDVVVFGAIALAVFIILETVLLHTDTSGMIWHVFTVGISVGLGWLAIRGEPEAIKDR